MTQMVNKSWIAVSIVLIIILLCSHSVCSESEPAYDLLDKTITKQMRKYDVPGVAIGIIKQGSVDYISLYGYQNIENEEPLTSQTLLRAESISKTVTAYIVMCLVEQGKLSLDTSIKDYIDISVPSEVTLHTLLTHSSGLEIGPFSEHYSPTDESIPSLRNHLIDTLLFLEEVPAQFNYSNVGYNLIQYVIEAVTQKSFNDVATEMLFDPLGIDDASFEYNDNQSSYYATGYDVEGTTIDPYIYPEQASGGLFISIGSLTRLMNGLMSDENILSNQYRTLLYTHYIDLKGEYKLVADGYGYGHFIEKNDPLGVFHGGQGHGFMAFYYANPTEKSAIVILTNSQRSYPMMSALVQNYTTILNLPSAKFSKIDTSISLMTLCAVLLGIALTLKMSHSLKNIKRHIIVDKQLVGSLVGLLIGVTIVLYLWLSQYFFLRVLYPIHVEYFRMLLTIYVVFEIATKGYRLVIYRK
jgi:CubicO group peptidase (beta-lactamase class C family)